MKDYKVVLTDELGSSNAHMENNPSARKDGILLECWCEGCSWKSMLAISQNSGNTYVEWMLQPSIG